MAMFSRFKSRLFLHGYGSSANNRGLNLSLTSEGFRGADSGGAVFDIYWADVIAIRTYKIDLFTSDTICLAFHTAFRTQGIEICEEDDGFMTVAGAMETLLPGIPSDWYSEVMVPAFERCERVIFVRETKKKGAVHFANSAL